jgi:hypothetical protein
VPRIGQDGQLGTLGIVYLKDDDDDDVVGFAQNVVDDITVHETQCSTVTTALWNS